MKPELIIFDCDGVLLDSEIIAHQVIAKEMPRLGFPITIEKSIELFSGTSEEAMPGIIENEYGRRVSDDDFKNIVRVVEDCFKDELKPVADIKHFIEHLENNAVKKCIASNSEYKYIVGGLSLLNMKPYFNDEHIFGIDMVEKGKPEPDLFLHAANKLQTKPENCIVIEDSAVGIAAAKAANIFVVGFLGGSHARGSDYYERIVEAKPDFIARDAFELLDAVYG